MCTNIFILVTVPFDAQFFLQFGLIRKSQGCSHIYVAVSFSTQMKCYWQFTIQLQLGLNVTNSPDNRCRNIHEALYRLRNPWFSNPPLGGFNYCEGSCLNPAARLLNASEGLQGHSCRLWYPHHLSVASLALRVLMPAKWEKAEVCKNKRTGNLQSCGPHPCDCCTCDQASSDSKLSAE